jgi:hypothetical protein
VSTAYAVVAAFDLFEYRNEARLFRRLSDRFEECVFGLNLVKRAIEEFQGGVYRQLRKILGSIRSASETTAVRHG